MYKSLKQNVCQKEYIVYNNLTTKPPCLKNTRQCSYSSNPTVIKGRNTGSHSIASVQTRCAQEIKLVYNF